MPYFLSKANTLDLVDPGELTRELLVRKIKCEIPGCTVQAVGILGSSVTIFICRKHEEVCDMSITARRSVEAAVIMVLKGHMAQAANAAYAGSEDEVTISFDGAVSLLSQARRLADATEIDQPPAPKILLPEAPGGIRPILASLPASNDIVDLPEFFYI